MPSKIARTGKVKVPKYGLISRHGHLCFVHDEEFIVGAYGLLEGYIGAKVVRLSGTITYTLAK